jgi:DNA-binding NarL/FixJ family response regulator
MPEQDPTIRVLCVDDHGVVLEGLELLIGRQPDMKVVASATTGEDAVRLFRKCRPNVTLMDLQLPTMSGLQAIGAIRQHDPEARIIVLTMYHGDEDIYRALKCGAATYLLKEALSNELVQVIRAVHRGERPIPPTVSALLAARDTHSSITPREMDVVRLIAMGMRNKEIGFALGIAEHTVKVHVKNVLAKLNVSDRAAAITVALRRGILHLD